MELVLKTSLAFSTIHLKQHISKASQKKTMAFSRLSFAASLVVFSSLIISSVANYGNQADPETGKLLPIAFEGVIMCKSGDKSYPIQGNLRRINWSNGRSNLVVSLFCF